MSIVPRFEHAPPILLAGIRRVHRFAELDSTIPAQWRDFVPLLPLAGQVGHTTYGAMCQQLPDGCEYMTGVQVEDFSVVPRELGRMRVPAQRYAVFTHQGHVSTIRDTWHAIWEEWLPASGLKPANTPDFERYDERFDAQSGGGIIEIWFPVEEIPPASV